MREEIKSLPLKKEQLEEELKSKSSELNSVKEERKKLKIEEDKKNLELKEAAEEIKKLNTSLHNVTTNKEYNAVMLEIKGWEEKVSTLEENILMLMEKEDEITSRTEKNAKELEQYKKDVQQKIQEAERRTEQLKKALKEKEKEREEKKKEVNEEIYADYEKIRKGKKSKGIAICELEGESCGGCFVFVPTYIAEKVKAKKEIVHCENCSRILY
jgi:uncharacterized protein